LLKGNFVPFGIDDSLGLVAVAMPLKERIKTALHGAIVILKPAMHWQYKVGLGAVAIPLEEPDFR
jgi:hypothetical protein